MVHVRESLTTDSPPSRVFAYLADFENVPGWDPGIASARNATGGPVAVGTLFDLEAVFFGRRIPVTYRVVALEADRRVRVEGRADGFHSVDTIEVEERAGRTHVTYDAQMSLTGVLRFVEWLLAPLLRRMGRKAVAGLAAALAAGAAAGQRPSADTRAAG
jgi:carbon monoxide dehydrogenase subunit G